MNQGITYEPAILANLDVDRWYSIQNQGTGVLRFQESSTVPVDDSDAFKLPPDGTAEVKKTESTEIYIWSRVIQGDDSTVVYDAADD